MIASQHKQAKLKPIKQRIAEAEKDKFWNDFHEGINEKSNKMIQKKVDMQATGISFKNPVTATEAERNVQYGTGGGQRPKKKTFANDRGS